MRISLEKKGQYKFILYGGVHKGAPKPNQMLVNMLTKRVKLFQIPELVGMSTHKKTWYLPPHPFPFSFLQEGIHVKPIENHINLGEDLGSTLIWWWLHLGFFLFDPVRVFLIYWNASDHKGESQNAIKRRWLPVKYKLQQSCHQKCGNNDKPLQIWETLWA